MTRTRRLATGLSVLLGGYWLWARTGRSAPTPPPKAYLEDKISLGQDQGHGNLVAVQPFMTRDDYRTAAALLAKLDLYLQEAAAAGWLKANTIVVFPEHIGTWLVAAGEREQVYAAASLDAALRHLVVAHLPRFLQRRRRTAAGDRSAAAIFHLKARTMAERYQTVFGRLARRYGVTILGGSIVLPAPAINAGQLRPGDGPLYNCSVIFTPDGQPLTPVTRKVHPTHAETPFTAAAAAADLPVYHTPAGRAGILICADSWYPDVYAALAPQAPELVLVPNHANGYGLWRQPWGGYDPGPAPADVDTADIGRLSEGEAWLKYALAGRLKSTGARVGIHVFLHGDLWDLSGDGATIIVHGEEVWQGPRVVGATLANYWLPE